MWCYFKKENQLTRISNREIYSKRFSDFLGITMKPNGIFWMPKTTNVNRFAPNLWQVDERFQTIDAFNSRSNMYLDPKNRFWIIDSNALHQLQQGRIIQSYPWPSDYPLHLGGVDGHVV